MSAHRFALLSSLLAVVFAFSAPALADAQDQTEVTKSAPRILLNDDEDDVTPADGASDNDAQSAQPEESNAGYVDNAPANADYVDNAPAADESSKEAGNSVIKGHGFQLAMSFLGIPDALLDTWFVQHGSTWDGVANMGFSLDYFLRFNVPCEMRFSLSWLNAGTGGAYWLDKDYSDHPDLADYIENNVSFVNLEVAAYHLIPIIDEIAFYYGGGFWGGVTLGSAHAHAIRTNCALTSDDYTTCKYEPGSVPVEGIPKVFGFVMVSLGFKFTVFDIMTIRAEGGFKGYLYGQLGVGVEF